MAEPEDQDRAVGRTGRSGRHPDDVVPDATNSWPAGWPRLYPEHATGEDSGGRGPAKGTQRVSFVGGSADGLTDLVEESVPGGLPSDVETMGSVYRLVQVPGDEPRYHWHGFEDN